MKKAYICTDGNVSIQDGVKSWEFSPEYIVYQETEVKRLREETQRQKTELDCAKPNVFLPGFIRELEKVLRNLPHCEGSIGAQLFGQRQAYSDTIERLRAEIGV